MSKYPPSPVDPVWGKRFNSLNGRISALQTMIATNSDKIDRYALFAKLANCLQQFATAQFHFFADGFQQGALEPSDEFPPDHVLAVTLQQISYDLEAIQWALEQRLNGDESTNEALEIGDRLAREALALGQVNFPNLGQVAVLCYFQKFAEIRVIPYASVALIGLPITCIPDNDGDRVARDFLATPHEIGHYVYWHAKIGSGKGTPLYQHLINQVVARGVTVAREWLEEIFADVYGCLVAGPVIAQSFQDLQMWVRQKNFYKDDGEHPTPYIRPDIYTKVLHEKINAGWAEAVHERWQDLRAEREKDNPPQLTRKVSGQKKQPADLITLTNEQGDIQIDPDANKPVDMMIELVLETLGTVITDNWWQQYAPLTESPTGTPDLYEAFGNHVETALTLPPPSDQAECLPPDGASPLQEQWHDDDWSPPLLSEEEQEEQPGWLNVFRAGGWATKGPQTNPVGG
jgi:hypothetical protein